MNEQGPRRSPLFSIFFVSFTTFLCLSKFSVVILHKNGVTAAPYLVRVGGGSFGKTRGGWGVYRVLSLFFFQLAEGFFNHGTIEITGMDEAKRNGQAL